MKKYIILISAIVFQLNKGAWASSDFTLLDFESVDSGLSSEPLLIIRNPETLSNTNEFAKIEREESSAGILLMLNELVDKDFKDPLLLLEMVDFLKARLQSFTPEDIDSLIKKNKE